MKRLFLIKAGTDLLPYLMPKLNQAHLPKKKRAIMNAGTDLILSYSKGKYLVQLADTRVPCRHMIFMSNITDYNGIPKLSGFSNRQSGFVGVHPTCGSYLNSARCF